LGPLINKAAASARMPVGKAIDKANDSAVFVDFVGVDEAINDAAESAQMMADEALDKVIAAGLQGSCRGCCAALATGGTQQSNRDIESEHWRTGGIVSGRYEVGTPAKKRQCRNKRHEEEEEVADAMAITEEDVAGVGMVAAG
jgi:hypothetical protein